MSNPPLNENSPARYLQDKIFTTDFQNELKSQISAAKPYNYGVVNGLFKDDVLRQARDEIFENIQFTEKETDIYKLNQTGDLLNIDGLAEEEASMLKTLHKVRDALYSKEMRDFVSYVTDCGPLSAKKLDLSLNNYDKGCHLLTHDDVITDRVISFILYLLPPDYKWDPKWGGALRLYPTLREGVPDSDYCGAVSPQWNQLSFFKIVPGHSFHDVEEVYVDQPRLSIQGWYHLPQKGEDGYVEKREGFNEEVSTMAQQSVPHQLTDGYIPRRKFENMQMSEDMEVLKPYISAHILERVMELGEKFADESILKLNNFLAPEFWDSVKNEIEELELKKCPVTKKDIEEPWGVCAPPHLRKYMYLNSTGEETPLQMLKDLFSSQPFGRFLERITRCEPTSSFVELRRFRPGIDFTLASVSGFKENILEAVLSVTPAKFDADVGGYDLVMSGGSDENDDPAVYRESKDESGGVLLSALPKPNEFIIILRDPDLLRFVKYVSKNAAGSRWDVHGEYHCRDEDCDDNMNE